MQVPSPIGFCVKCIVRGRRIQATAISDGDGLCDACVIDERARDAGQVTQAWNGLMAYDRARASDSAAHG